MRSVLKDLATILRSGALALSLACLLAITGCGAAGGGNGVTADSGTEIGNPRYDVSLAGVAQKGPFMSGSTVSIHELDEGFAQTGTNSRTRINDELSSYACNVSVRSPYAAFYVQGFYFDEITGGSSESQLEISALADIQSGDVNINLLTALSDDRIVYLVTELGMNFSDAKNQAENEVLRVFGIDGVGLLPFEKMNILRDGDSHAALLAVSVILMQAAHNTEDAAAVTAALSEIIAQIQIDIEADGVIDPAGSMDEQILEAMRTVDVVAVRNHLESRYVSMDPDIVIPRFEQYITGDLGIE